MERVSRYLCYPSILHFVEEVGAEHYLRWIQSIQSGSKIGLYLHIPFCEKLCWFCACRTQAVHSHRQVGSYVESLIREIRLVGSLVAGGVKVDKLHWSGGSPMVLSRHEIGCICAAINSAFEVSKSADFAVEIDAHRPDKRVLDSYLEHGMTRGKLFVHDSNPDVQKAIGRAQDFADVQSMADMLRGRGLRELGVDMLYGLPRQDCTDISNMADAVIALAPERVGLSGYSHVPWLAKRQSMIDESDLPDHQERTRQYRTAVSALHKAGYRSVGVDHFAKPTDSLVTMAREGRLRRRHLSYTDTDVAAVIGLGASAISSFPQGRVQNLQQTLAYRVCVDAGDVAAERGWALSLEDRIRGRAIEMLMCSFAVDLSLLQQEFGDFARIILPSLASAKKQFCEKVELTGDALKIVQDGPVLARPVAKCLDTRTQSSERYCYAV